MSSKVGSTGALGSVISSVGSDIITTSLFQGVLGVAKVGKPYVVSFTLWELVSTGGTGSGGRTAGWREVPSVKQVYKITYPTGKIYIGKDSVGSYRYFGSPDIMIVNADFMRLPETERRDYTVRKQILWESDTATEEELSAMEIRLIREYQSNNPVIGYNRFPPHRTAQQ